MAGVTARSALLVQLMGVASYVSGSRRVASATNQMHATFATAEQRAQQTAVAYGLIGAAAAAIGGILTNVARVIVENADAERVLVGATNQLAANQGILTSAIEGTVDAIQAQVFSDDQAYKNVNKLIGVERNHADAIKLATAANDIATAQQLDRAETFDLLTDAIANHNVNSLKQISIAAGSSRVFGAFAETMEKTGEEMTTAERRTATFNYVLGLASKYAGAFDATADTISRRVQKLNLNLGELGDTIGTYLLPYAALLLDLANNLVKAFLSLPPSTQKVISLFAAGTGVFLALAGAITFASVAFKPLVGALQLVVPDLLKTVFGIKAIQGAVVVLGPSIRLFRALGNALRNIGAWGGTVAQKALNGTAATLYYVSRAVLGVLKSISLVGPALALFGIASAGMVVAVKKNIGNLGDAFEYFTKVKLPQIGEGFKTLAVYAVAAFRLIPYAFEQFVRAFEPLIAKYITPLFVTDFGINFNSMAERFALGGAKIMIALASGIIQGMTVIIQAITMVAEVIASFLVGQSPPPEGPLSTIDMGGYKIIEAWVNGMKQYPLESIKKLAESVSNQLMRALWAVEDALYDIESRERELDKALWPFEDALYRAEMAARLIIIPLQRQLRALRKQRAEVERLAKAERKRFEDALAAIDKQVEALQKLLEQDKERLELIDHELFIENLRNRIIKRETSLRALTLRAQKMELEDILAQREAELEELKKARDLEQERLDAFNEIVDKQLEALDAQIEAIELLIDAEEERVLWAREELELAQARQAEQRLALEQEKRAWEEQQRTLQRMEEILQRANQLIKDQEKDAGGVADSWEDLAGVITGAKTALEKMQLPKLDPKAIEDAMAKIKAMFDEDLRGPLDNLKTAVSDLQTSLDKLNLGSLKEAYDTFKKADEDTVGMFERIAEGIRVADEKVRLFFDNIVNRKLRAVTDSKEQDDRFWEGFLKGLREASPEIVAFFEELPGKLQVGWGNIVKSFDETFVKPLQRVFGPLLEDISGAFEKVGKVLEPAIKLFGTFGTDSQKSLEETRKSSEETGYSVGKTVGNIIEFFRNMGGNFDTAKKSVDQVKTSVDTSSVSIEEDLIGVGVKAYDMGQRFTSSMSESRKEVTKLDDKISDEFTVTVADLDAQIRKTATYMAVDWVAAGELFLVESDKIVAFMRNNMVVAWVSVSDAINKAIDAIKSFLDWFRQLPSELPSWLQRNSPSELELSLLGAAEAVSLFNKVAGPMVSNLRAINANKVGDLVSTGSLSAGSLRSVQSTRALPQSVGTVNNITKQGPSIAVSANYAKSQSPTTIRDDLWMLSRMMA